MTIGLDAAVADLSELAARRIGAADVGKSIYVTAEGAWYEAMREGQGLTKWRAYQPSVGTFAYRRVFDHEDSDVDVADTDVAIDLGDALPDDAVITGIVADVTEDWDDGAGGTFGLDVGVSGGDADAYTPTQLDIDGGVAVLTQQPLLRAGGVQLAVTIEGDVNLNTLTGGAVELTVYFMVPLVTTIAAP